MAAAAALCLPFQAQALIVESMTGTTAAPADDPGWNYVAGSGSRAFTYLGDGWALSAFHVGVPGASELLHFPGGSFKAIPNQAFTVKNPVGSGLTTDTDLRLIRINGDLATPNFTIASQPIFESTPLAQREVVITGSGPSRQATQTHWNVQVVPGSNNDVWTEVASGGTYHGYKAAQPEDDVKRWGKNQIADEDVLVGGNDNDLRFPLQLQLGVGQRDVMSMVIKFDAPGSGGLTNEVQVVAGDSGSAVFYKRNNQWELIGIVNALYSTYENQATSNAVYGNYSSFADLSYYRNELMNIINANPNYSLLGDINLDGNVSGNGTGAVASDDVSAFVAGWLYDNGTGVGNVTSWTKGDLSRDGKTDVADFFLLRSALNPSGTGAGLSLAALVGSAGVPEPASFLLAMLGVAPLALRRNRRRFPASS